MLTIAQIGPESDAPLRILFGRYLLDMAEWFEFDTATAYDAASVWERTVYIAEVDGVPVGFALIGSGEKWGSAHDVHEFFIAPEHRRLGAGKTLAAFVWTQHPGDWLVRVLEDNAPAVSFWRAAASNYSCVEEQREVSGRSWRFFRFRT